MDKIKKVIETSMTNEKASAECSSDSMHLMFIHGKWMKLFNIVHGEYIFQQLKNRIFSKNGAISLTDSRFLIYISVVWSKETA